ncbi:MAG: acyltransferase [Deltaproteobacteria bacterium]|nr:acyltransferase [Deltaproteobacteria bacterium]
MKYRADIDGIRAIAVLAVVIYHAFPDILPGGFIGVDVFFVISGYLISGIIISEIKEDRFSILNFYDRRIRRIFPALFALVSAVMLMGWLTLIPVIEFRELSQSVSSVALFLSNMYFWYKTDYFSQAAELKPLLHTWSLAVEEQFYIIWPLFLAFLFRKTGKKGITAGILSFLLLSLAISLILTKADPSAAFYMAPSRFWELAAGGILAIGINKLPFPEKVRGASQILAFSGIILSFLFIDDQAIFPGFVAIIPVTCTMLLIRAGTDGQHFIRRLLSSKPFVMTGKISYSLYLWHWPLLAFARIYHPDHEVMAKPAILLFTFFISVLSWKYIETPFRKSKKTNSSGYKSLAFGGALIAVWTLFGLTGHRNWGYPSRLSGDLAEQSDYIKNSPHFVCNGLYKSQIGSGPASIALWGDSHAADLCPVMKQLTDLTGTGSMNYIQTSCLPLITQDGSSYRKGCNTSGSMSAILSNPQITTVILAGEWPAQEQQQTETILSAIRHTITTLTASGKHVIFIGDVPVYQTDITVCHLRSEMLRRFGLQIRCASGNLDKDQQITKQSRIRSLVQSLKTETKERIDYVDRIPYFCPENQCLSYHEGKPLYRDSNHLTIPGSLIVFSEIQALMNVKDQSRM